MKAIRSKKVQLLVSVTIKCNLPQEYNKASEFWDGDGQDIIPSISDYMHHRLDGFIHGDAIVDKIYVKHPKK